MTQQVKEEILTKIEQWEALDYEFEVCDNLEIPQSQNDIDEEDAFYGNEEEQEEQAFIWIKFIFTVMHIYSTP